MSNFQKAAEWTDRKNPLPHQMAAWQFAWSCLTNEEQQEFLDLFRSAVVPKQADCPNTWQGVATAARQCGAAYPQLVAAQWALESAYGQKPTGTFNMFGLKGSGAPTATTEFIDGKQVQIVDEFLNFESLREAIQYLVSRWYLDFNGYKGVNRCANRELAAKQLQIEGYATDPSYASHLIELLRVNAPVVTMTQDRLKTEAKVWRTRVNALNLSQPDARTCQAACLAMALADPDITSIYRQLERTGVPGDPFNMAEYAEAHYPAGYELEMQASLNDCIEWLEQGELLITHGWFTASGHVIVLDGLRKPYQHGLGFSFDVKDPWSKFNSVSWRYDSQEKFFDGYYSDVTIYAACVAGQSRGDAHRIASRHIVNLETTGMWVHRFRPES